MKFQEVLIDKKKKLLCFREYTSLFQRPKSELEMQRVIYLTGTKILANTLDFKMNQ
jgi:hypothetical protein